MIIGFKDVRFKDANLYLRFFKSRNFQTAINYAINSCNLMPKKPNYVVRRYRKNEKNNQYVS
jgi:hypothetical protein